MISYTMSVDIIIIIIKFVAHLFIVLMIKMYYNHYIIIPIVKIDSQVYADFFFLVSYNLIREFFGWGGSLLSIVNKKWQTKTITL